MYVWTYWANKPSESVCVCDMGTFASVFSWLRWWKWKDRAILNPLVPPRPLLYFTAFLSLLLLFLLSVWALIFLAPTSKSGLFTCHISADGREEFEQAAKKQMKNGVREVQVRLYHWVKSYPHLWSFFTLQCFAGGDYVTTRARNESPHSTALKEVNK